MKKLTTMQQTVIQLAKQNNIPIYECPVHNIFTSTKGNKCPYCNKECDKYEM